MGTTCTAWRARTTSSATASRRTTSCGGTCTTCSAFPRASYLVLHMHVVVASHQPLPAKGYGGPQRVVVALVRGLAPLGHRLPLLAPPSTQGPKATGGSRTAAGGWRARFAGPIKWVGEVDGRAEPALRARPAGPWTPGAWAEPFGLVTIEALFSGTPVLGTHRGALPELITPEVGTLCDTVDEMIAAAESIHTRSPAACRAHAERHFTHLTMAEGYLREHPRGGGA